EGTYHSTKHCNNCGYETDENFEYCPKCGQKF
ncbi:MAG: zinc-ribbon domain-containing protein, partial [Agathobacter sp.]